ncbi:2Fe-2S iron-sulfur cluster-binding protein [Thalassobaculum sp. OXR-137]|uniref:2Fe-2S iron-sulfur cluster-binding protein n=1 Tax=Thalassobaculum sp. OXR-137 TaxID=3100173 RepID=UPI002AC8DE58|nr:2Fe-2S iron-sulfur cluster-binding protein [Thalassobaculum sp. OXR-137]WPZ34308.1 2Fe-2S iron-sulfur cluster-binding protein [Thalassobaculum sp. OXR-137]
MKIIVTDRDGGEHAVEATKGWRVMEIIREAGLPITAECGGACACATCHVYVAPEWWDRLEPRGEEENDMLDLAFEVQENSRLSCQILFDESLDGLKVTLAPE